MTKKQTIALTEIPLPDRLGYARKLANGEPVNYLGLTVVNEPTSAKAKADALAAMPASFRLTQARLAQNPKSTPELEYAEPAGGFDGTCFVRYDSNED